MKIKSILKNIFVIVLVFSFGLMIGNYIKSAIKHSNKTMMKKLIHNVKLLDNENPKPKDLKKNLNKDYFFIFFGAEWCPYCKESKDEITRFYSEYTKKYDNFAFILAGAMQDTSNEDLTKYLKTEEYPFYYVDFEKRDETGFFELPAYKNCEKFYIPAFILIDRAGNVLANSNGPLSDDYSEYRPFEYYKTIMSNKEVDANY